MKKLILTLIIPLVVLGHLKTQSIYFCVNAGTSSSIWQLDLGTCSRTELYAGITPRIDDFVETSGGFYYCNRANSVTGRMYFYDTSTGTSTLLTTLNTGATDQRLLLISPTKILWVLNAQFYEFDLTTNTATLLASFPNARSWSLFTYNGQIYYFEGIEPGPLQTIVYTITLSPTLQRSFVTSLLFPLDVEGLLSLDMATSCDMPISVIGNLNHTAQIYNMQNYTYSPHCSWEESFLGGNYVTAPLLNDLTGPLCNCTTEAGTWNWANLPGPGSPLTICANGTTTLPHNGDEILESGQNLSFVLLSYNSGLHLYENLQNGVVYIYDSPVLSFIPGVIQPNTPYVIYPVASNAPPGSINLNDPCRDIQYPITIIWEVPTVTFTTPSVPPCTDGCRSVNILLQGQSPFQLSYEVVFSGGSAQVFNQTFANNFNTIQICPPPGFEGEVQINALSLTAGNNCSCN